MSKNKKTAALKEDKSNAIVSKLLGAHPSEINIEKLRGKTPQTKYQLNGKASKQLLKAITNKFSLPIIFILDISFQNIKSIQDLHECNNLLILNMSNNQISDLKPLQTCISIKHLDASHNEILNLDPLENLKELVHLQLQANYLKSMMYLQVLSKLENLKTVYLRNSNGENANEVCKETSYVNKMFEMIQSLKRLDGFPRYIKQLPLTHDLKDQSNFNLEDGKLSNQSQYWYTQDWPKENKEPVKLIKEQSLQKEILSCQDAANEVDKKIKMYSFQL